jgi:NADH:ubiquinone oxidoreductase subunit 2 (subunit N)
MASLQVLTAAPEDADVEARGRVPVPALTTTAIGICVVFTVVFGVVPGPILDFARQATLLLLG